MARPSSQPQHMEGNTFRPFHSCWTVPNNQLGHLPAFSTVSTVWALDLPAIDQGKVTRGLVCIKQPMHLGFIQPHA